MNVLIFEYITGGGMIGEPLPHSLVKEGELMLNAAADDFAVIQDVTVTILRDYRLQSNKQCFQEIVVSNELDYEHAIDQCENIIDALLIIAPETENILYKLCAKYSKYNFILLNCDPESIALTTDKYRTYLFLEKHGIDQVPTYLLNEIEKLATNKIVAKPRDGVGCENILLIDSINNIQKQNIPDNYIVQPYLEGQHISLSLICWNKECLLLSVNQQCILEKNNSLMLELCIVNDLSCNSFEEISRTLITSLVGLKGYVGVDLVIANDEIYLVEVNPRLTTSYVGIRSALDINPAQLILQTFLDKKLPIFKKNENNSIVVNPGVICAA